MSTPTIDYDKLAAQAGGSVSVDYDAIAAQHGGSQEGAAQGSGDSLAPRGGWSGGEFLRGAASGIKNAVLHPINTAAGMAQGAMASGMSPMGEGYPSTSATGNPEDSQANAQVQQDAQQGQQQQAQFIKQNPAYAAGGMAGTSALLAGLTAGAIKGPSMLADAGDAAMTRAKNLIAGPPEAQMVKAIQPSKSNVNFEADLKTALPQMKSAESQLGKPVAGFDDALQAAGIAKKSIWQQVQARFTAAGQTGATIDGSQVADAMMDSIDKRMSDQNPGLAAKIKSLADTYRRPMDVNEAEDFIQSNNKELAGYYAKNKVSQQAAEADPEIAAKVAEGNALRSALYDKIDSLAGPGVSQLKQAYGAVNNVQKEMMGQALVYARKAPLSLGEQQGYLGAGIKLITGDVIGAAKDVAVRRFLSDVNDKNSMISRSFEQTDPAQPFPGVVSPRLAGLLQRGPLQVPTQDASGAMTSQPPPVDATTRAQRLGLLLPERSGGNVLPYNPQMSGGEQMASLLHYLRQNPQLALPAKAGAIPLPPPQ